MLARRFLWIIATIIILVVVAAGRTPVVRTAAVAGSGIETRVAFADSKVAAARIIASRARGTRTRRSRNDPARAAPGLLPQVM
jgi:hypothetical protein